MFRKFSFCIVALSGALLATAQQNTNLALMIRGRPIFEMPIIWASSESPDNQHSEDLWNALEMFGNGPKAGVAAIEGFIQAHPDSVWLPSLDGNLAEYYRDAGRYTLALNHWEAAWAATKDSQDANSRQIAARTVARWSRLLGSLGKKDLLETLFAEASQRGFDKSSYAAAIQSSREGFLTMKAKPEIAYRCGSFALTQVGKIMNPQNGSWKSLSETPSPEGGFTMADLMRLASEHTLNLIAVRRPEGPQELIVPSVVHWQLNHYAAIVGQDGSRFKVIDPTFGQPRWMDAETINAEASGNFMVPEDKLPASWKALSKEEAAQIHGKGWPNDLDDTDDQVPDDDDPCDPPPNPPEAADGSCVWDDPSGTNCPSCGMATWRVSEPYTSLWLQDTPLFYRDSKTWMQLKLSYNQRAEDKDGRFSGFGNRWECNWLNYVQADGSSTTEFVGGGGQRSYTPDGIAVEYNTGNRMVFDASTGGSGPASIPVIQRRYADSRRYEYALAIAAGKTNFFLTHRIDRYGRIQHFNYQTITNTSTVVRVTNITDFDGKVITFNYTNAQYPQLITSVSNSYGGGALFLYHTNGMLTNITDMAGLVSYFAYDASGMITNLHTPYSNTWFKSFAPTNVIGGNGGSGLNRAIEITEPGGLKQLYTYRDDGYTTNNVDSVSGYYRTPDSGYYMHRNSYHWNRQQYASLSPQALTNYLDMPAQDYWKASLKHWLHKPWDPGLGRNQLSGTLSGEAGPVLDIPSGQRIGSAFYRYHGQADGDYVHVGTVAWVTNTTRYFGDVGSQQARALITARNDQGRPILITHYSFLNEAMVTFTNEYDLGGKRLLRQWGPRGELVRGYGYSTANSNLLTSVTNALGEVTRYTHDTNTFFVTSITRSSGLLTTNVYYASGTYSNFLQTSIDVGFSTNSYTYTNGNVYVKTNELGLVTTNAWDALNRLTSVTYPDGTTISNAYSNLDLVEVKDRMNGRKKFVYNNLRQLTYTTNENGAATQYQYCDCGSLSSITRFLGGRSLVTHLDHNLAGQLTSVVFPDAYSLTNYYDVASLLTNRTDSSGRSVWFSYNEYSTLKETGISNRLFLHRDFDEYNRVLKSTDQDGVTVTNSFDLLGRVLDRRALGASDLAGLEHFVYDVHGLTNYTDPLGKLTSFVRDESGRVLRQTNANNQTLLFAYNPADQLLTLTDGNAHTTRWNYDQYGRATNKLDVGSNVVFRCNYDPNNQLTNRWTPAKSNVTYRYDLVGNLTNVVYPTSTNIVLRYDDLNRLTNLVDGVGSTAFTWTDGNQLASEDGPWASDTVSYIYNNRLRSGLSVSAPTASPWTQGYAYDEFYRLTNLTSPAGIFGTQYKDVYSILGAQMAGDLVSRLDLPSGAYIENSQDTLGRLTSSALTKPDTTVINSHTYLYNEGHQRTNQTFAAGNYMNYAYDNIGQLTNAIGKELDGASRWHENRLYSYDAAGNLTARGSYGLLELFNLNSLNEVTNTGRAGNRITVAGTTTGPATNVTVNTSNAVLYADNSFASTNHTLANGNNTFTAIAKDSYGRADTNTVNSYLPSPVNFSYDLNGNLLTNAARIFDYDDENQLIRVTQPTAWKSEFAYDGLMRLRIRREYTWLSAIGNWQLTNEVHYIYDGLLVVQERDANNLPQVTYTRGNDLSASRQGAGGIGALLARSDNRLLVVGDPNASAFYHADAGGNISCLIDPSNAIVARYSYDPFGYLIAAAGPLAEINLYRFSSKEFHVNSGLIYYLYRFYDPSLQRWLNQDPLGERGGINLFMFADNACPNYLDPLGLEVCIMCHGVSAAGFCGDVNRFSDYLPGNGPNAAAGYQFLEDTSIDAAITVGLAMATGPLAEAESAAAAAIAAKAARDRVLNKIAKNVADGTLSKAKRKNIATVVGAVDTSTGKAVAVAKSSSVQGPGVCAEDMAVKLLGGPKPTIRITPAIRPRTGEVIPPCVNCQRNYTGLFLTE